MFAVLVIRTALLLRVEYLIKRSIMRWREFMRLLGGAAAAWPLPLAAQQPAMPQIGFLRSTSLADSTQHVAAFRQCLKETGFVEGRKWRFAILACSVLTLVAPAALVSCPAVADATLTVAIGQM